MSLFDEVFGVLGNDGGKYKPEDIHSAFNCTPLRPALAQSGVEMEETRFQLLSAQSYVFAWSLWASEHYAI